MMQSGPQKWFCNACGREMHSPPDRAVGRNFRTCSIECVREMEWRSALSVCNEPYRSDPNRNQT